jgi:rubrerythrin
MKTYICEICGDAYIGTEAPKNCPFCGARENFIKLGKEAKPIVNEKVEISEASKKNLETTYNLEVRAVAIYNCMAGKAKTYEIKAMYKRLAKVEMEHATIATKLLEVGKPEVGSESCSDEDIENFKKTIELEENATNLYKKFMQEAGEPNIKILFTALSQVESDHIELIKNYLND